MMVSSTVTPPCSLSFNAPRSSSPAIRRKSASPYSIPRYSPYKLSQPLLSNHPSPAPPAYSLPVTSQPPNTFEYKSSLFQPTTHVKLGFSLHQDGVQINPNSEQVFAILNLFPTAFIFSLHNSFIVVTCAQLPPKP